MSTQSAADWLSRNRAKKRSTSLHYYYARKAAGTIRPRIYQYHDHDTERALMKTEEFKARCLFSRLPVIFEPEDKPVGQFTWKLEIPSWYEVRLSIMVRRMFSEANRYSGSPRLRNADPG